MYYIYSIFINIFIIFLYFTKSLFFQNKVSSSLLILCSNVTFRLLSTVITATLKVSSGIIQKFDGFSCHLLMYQFSYAFP